MGLFSFMKQDVPRADIPEKQRGAVGTVLHIYSSKMTKNIASNLIFLVGNIPALIIAYVATVFILPLINTKLSPTGLQEFVSQLGLKLAEQSAKDADVTMQLFVMIVVFVTLFVVGMTLVSVGPVQTGLSYVYRNYARNKPTFLWGDFVATVKKEWKQSLAASLVTLIITGILVFNIAFYNTMIEGAFTEILLAVFVVLLVFFLCIQMYVYPMIASVNLKLSQVYRNAALLFVARFPQTIVVFLLNVVFLALIPGFMLFSFSTIGLILAMIYYAFFAFSFVHIMNSCFVWKQIERFLIRSENDPEKSDEEGKSISDEVISSDEQLTDAPSEADQGE